MRRAALWSALAGALALAWPSTAHEGYPADCCHDQDCRPALPEEVVLQADGRYRIVPTGEVFARWQVRPSFDARFHRCLYDRSNPVSRTFCLLVPADS